mmetsp:Transcript_34632/g.83622  ORF Transcript_34632/g.83622 Transcript_34632/m.83622 type:complete len:162 (+) Transcript_34632:730-1215(+)
MCPWLRIGEGTEAVPRTDAGRCGELRCVKIGEPSGAGSSLGLRTRTDAEVLDGNPDEEPDANAACRALVKGPSGGGRWIDDLDQCGVEKGTLGVPHSDLSGLLSLHEYASSSSRFEEVVRHGCSGLRTQGGPPHRSWLRRWSWLWLGYICDCKFIALSCSS